MPDNKPDDPSGEKAKFKANEFRQMSVLRRSIALWGERIVLEGHAWVRRTAP
jgi:hypothetical protein